MLLLVPRLSNAVEWWAEPSVRLGAEYNDNITWTTQPHGAIQGDVFSPRADLGIRSEIWQVNSSIGLVTKRYPGNAELDRNDRLFTLSSQYKTERSSWQLDGSLTHDAVLAGQESGPDLGVVPIQIRKDASSVSPSWTRTITERTQLQLTYELDDVAYVGGASAGYFDYRARTVTSKLINQLSLQNQIFVMAGYSSFDVPFTGLDSKTSSVQAGTNYAFSETLQLTLIGGSRKTVSQGVVLVCPNQTSPVVLFGQVLCFDPTILSFVPKITATATQEQSGNLFNVSLDKQFETAHLNITLGRALNAAGTGEQLETNTVSFLLESPMTPKVTGALSTNFQDIRSITGVNTGADRKLRQIEPKLRWQWTREWNVNLVYNYTYLKRTTESQRAIANMANLTLIYQWPRISVSK